MLFNSPYYIFTFLPLAYVGYFLIQRLSTRLAGKMWLVAMSLYFYSYWNPKYLVLILCSITVNYFVGRGLHRTKLRVDKQPRRHKALLIAGISFNLSLLGWFKYADFFLSNVNVLLGSEFPLLHLVLPLAISFFTFQQIAYLVDCYQFETQEYDFTSYCLFVCFFPQLIAGPIVHHREMMPQFQYQASASINWNNTARGVLIFSIGLFKKVVIADSLAIWANQGYADPHNLDFYEAWATSLSYTFQLYYDFSGYTDMAIGAALLFNIRLPLNFNSPYKATNIQEFWHRWHMTLSRWLRDYVYIPLGGNREGPVRLYFNLILTFVLGGLWHGAGWTFILWGALHGLALSLHRFWTNSDMRLPAPAGWLLTFLFVHLALVFFRAEDVSTALSVFNAMLGHSGFDVLQLSSWQLMPSLDLQSSWDIYDNWKMLAGPGNFAFLSIFALVAILSRNSMELAPDPTHFNLLHIAITVTALLASILLGISSTAPEFLYFNF